MPLMKTKPTSPGRRSMVKVVILICTKASLSQPWLSHNSKKLVVTIMVTLRHVTKAVVTSITTAWLTLSATIRMVSPLRLSA